MNARDLKMEEISRNRVPYLKMVYALCGFFTLFYIFKFNFEFHAPEHNGVLIPLWVSLMAIPPLLVKILKNYKMAAIWTCTFAAILLIYLIYLSGGLSAPGLFWIASIPLVLSMLFEKQGALAGYAVVLSTLIFFTYSHQSGDGPNVVREHANFHVEMVTNLIGFIIFCSVTARAYHKREVKYSEELLQKTNNVESMLRVLLHDIANTLSSMTYNLIRIKEGQDGGSHGELEKIEKAIEAIHTLLFQVRHLKSIKDGKSPMPLRPISLPMVLNEVYELTENLALQKGLKLNWDLSREKMNVHGDKTILSNVVLTNIVNNAIKFSHPGGRIDVLSYKKDSFAVVEVRDHGIGMPKEILENLFSLNYTTTRSGTAGEKGTGYGMPLAKEYLLLMGGEIEVTSSEEKKDDNRPGTLVMIKLPLATHSLLSGTSLEDTHD
jgi:Signal transduction histidine kinase